MEKDNMNENKELNDFILALRELRERIEVSQGIAEHAVESLQALQTKAGSFEKQVAHMIETYPEVWGKGGSERRKLERIAEEKGLDGDLGLESDNGPYNATE